MGLISYSCIAVKSLSTKGKLPSKYVTVLNFSFSFIFAGLALSFYCTSILHIVHTWILYLLALLGWEIGYFEPIFQPISGHINLFSTGGGGNSGKGGGSSNTSTSIRSGLSSQLANIT